MPQMAASAAELLHRLSRAAITRLTREWNGLAARVATLAHDGPPRRLAARQAMASDGHARRLSYMHMAVHAHAHAHARRLSYPTASGRDLPPCDPQACDAGLECAICLVRLTLDEIADELDERGQLSWPAETRCGSVELGRVCEGSGECGTADAAPNATSATGGGVVGRPVYRRVACSLAPLAPPAVPPSPAPPPSPPVGPPPMSPPLAPEVMIDEVAANVVMLALLALTSATLHLGTLLCRQWRRRNERVVSVRRQSERHEGQQTAIISAIEIAIEMLPTRVVPAAVQEGAPHAATAEAADEEEPQSFGRERTPSEAPPTQASWHGHEEGDECAVCLCEFEAGQTLRLLPCGHAYHRECIDKWLLGCERTSTTEVRCTCPLCKSVTICLSPGLPPPVGSNTVFM